MRFVQFLFFRHALVYYAFQSKVIKAVEILLTRIGMLPISQYAASLIVAMITAIILIIPAYFIRKRMPFLLKVK